MQLKTEIIKVSLKTIIKADTVVIRIDPSNILACDITQGEMDRSSSCNIDIFDPDGVLSNKLYEKIDTDGGIIVPASLFETPEPVAVGDTGSVDIENIQDGLKGDPLAEVIVAYAKSNGVSDLSHIAYILASVDHESKMGIYTSEIGGESARYAPWYGRGLIQLTWQSNYEKWKKKLGYDFIAEPDAVSKLKYAVPIAVLGMRDGDFTGIGLSDFGTGGSFDAVGARKIVNGTDRASEIASIYNKYLKRLQSGELQGKAVDTGTATTRLLAIDKPIDKPATIAPGRNTAGTGFNAIPSFLSQDANAVDQNSIDAAIVETVDQFTTLLIEWGYSDDDVLTNYPFIWTGIDYRNKILTLSGSGIDVIIASNVINETVSYKNTSLRAFAGEIAKELGINLEIKETPLSEATISINQKPGESKYIILGKLAQQQGYRLKTENTKITLEPVFDDAPQYTLLSRFMATQPSFSESAGSDRITGKGFPDIVMGITQASSQPTPDAPVSDDNPPGDTIPPTVPSDVVSGLSDEAKSLQNAKRIEQINKAFGSTPIPAARSPLVSSLNEEAAGLRDEPLSTRGSDNQTARDVNRDQSLTNYQKKIEEDHEIGEGFKVTIDYVRTGKELLQLKPGSVVAIENPIDHASKMFGGQYRIKTLQHRYPGSRTRISLYRPVWVKRKVKPPSSGSASGDSVGTASGQKIVEIARSFIGQRYKPDVSAQCANFVRHVFGMAGITLPVTADPFDDYLPTSEGFANSMAGAEIGEVFTDQSQLRAGDLVFFSNTYGEFPNGTITHIGIYTANGSMVDRSTSEKPLEERPITIFTWACGVHPKSLS